MSKYARFIWRHNDVDHITHLVDVVDMGVAAYQPCPLLGCTTDDELLSKLFAPNKAQWVADDEWFVRVPAGVQNSAIFIGVAGEENDPSKYVNPDNTDGNGTPIEPSPDDNLEPDLFAEPDLAEEVAE